MAEFKFEYAGHVLKPNGGRMKCNWCENTQISLRCIEEIETGDHHKICRECEDKVKELIMRR